ncbi:MAG: TA system antitoxin ParD family protein [Acidimicrobiales bacterium]
MAHDHITRFDNDLFEATADEGRRERRSARQQLEHWTRLGRETSARETVARRRIALAARGELPLSALTTEDRVAANLELDVAIRERAATTSFGRTLVKTGLTAVALDDDGVVAEFCSDCPDCPVCPDCPDCPDGVPRRLGPGRQSESALKRTGADTPAAG